MNCKYCQSPMVLKVAAVVVVVAEMLGGRLLLIKPYDSVRSDS